MPAIERRGRVLVATLACAPVDAIDATLPARLDVRMMERKSGRIVNIAIDAGRVGCRRWRPASVDALPPHQRRRGFLPLAALPRPTGKLLRRKLQDLRRTLNARQQASSVESTERQAH